MFIYHFRYLGALLTGQNNRENLIVLGGLPRTGKSLLLSLINEVVETYNVPTAVKLDAAQIVGYAQGQFARSVLLTHYTQVKVNKFNVFVIGKQLMTFNDVSDAGLQELADNRNLYEGQKVQGHRKYEHFKSTKPPPVFVTTNATAAQLSNTQHAEMKCRGAWYWFEHNVEINLVGGGLPMAMVTATMQLILECFTADPELLARGGNTHGLKLPRLLMRGTYIY